jgi:hypothetical protein
VTISANIDVIQRDHDMMVVNHTNIRTNIKHQLSMCDDDDDDDDDDDGGSDAGTANNGAKRHA